MSKEGDDIFEQMMEIARQRLDAGAVAQAIARGTDEFGRPRPLPWDVGSGSLSVLPTPPPSTADAGLRNAYGPGSDAVAPGAHGGGQLAANLRPSTNVDDRRVLTPSVMRSDWIGEALSKALDPDPETSELNQALLNKSRVKEQPQ